MRKICLVASALCLLFISCKKDSAPPPATPPPVIIKSSEKNISTFSFTKALNPQLTADITASVSGSNITAAIQYGIDITQLVASFAISEKAKAYVGTVEQISGSTKNNFTSAVGYKIVAEDGTEALFSVQVQRSGNAPNNTINSTTSFFTFNGTKSILAVNSITGGTYSDQYLARAYFDFDKDGDEDLMASGISGTESTKNIQYYKNNAGVFTESPSSFTTQKGLVHARKMIVQDFNKDGFMDAVIAGHGWDQPPFPGEKNILLINNAGNSFTPSELPIDVGFYHSGTAGDIDNDGDIDLFFTDTKVNKFLLNNGSGSFTYNADTYPATLNFKNYFTSELYDLNSDGYLDLIIAGHEQDGAQSMVLWGDFTGKYATTRMSPLPAVPGKGIIIAIIFNDLNGDGKTDLILNRTGESPFYQGYYVQAIINTGTSFTDATTTIISQNASTTEKWVDWYRFRDMDNDGDLDFFADNTQRNLLWKNNGSGIFSK